MPLLKLDKDDPEKELEFEVKCSLEYTPEERLERWIDWNISMLKFAEQQSHEDRNPDKIIKRT